MEMNQVRYFLAVCEHRNFTQAARSANVSQPALTTAIQKLEDELGGQLFLRDRSGCQLTPLGELIKPRVERIMSEAGSLTADAVRFVRLDRVPIRIGVSETVGVSTLSKGIAAYQRAYPTTDIELISTEANEALVMLREGRIDCLIGPEGDYSRDLYKADHLFSERYMVVFSKGHPFSGSHHISLRQVGDETYLDRPNCEMRETLLSLCAEKNIEIYAAYRSNRDSWLLAMAAEGVGVTILPETCIPSNGDTIEYCPLVEPELSRQLVALRYRKQPSRPEVGRLIIELGKINPHSNSR
ncbi:MAG: LysR family transcriptional regulator [Pseudomonadota bacterium]|nr:LysR family transcriptional regulator [Pseudomonadota bacterium]